MQLLDGLLIRQVGQMLGERIVYGKIFRVGFSAREIAPGHLFLK